MLFIDHQPEWVKIVWQQIKTEKNNNNKIYSRHNCLTTTTTISIITFSEETKRKTPIEMLQITSEKKAIAMQQNQYRNKSPRAKQQMNTLHFHLMIS